MNYLNNTLTVDVGLSSPTGWAYWNGTKCPKVGEIKCPSKLLKNHYVARNYITNHFDDLLWKFFYAQRIYGVVYLEGVQMYRDVVGQAAIRKKGIFELSYLVGRLEQCCHEYKLECKIINANEWKGQMTKPMTAAKIKMINGISYSSEHITDAVGMGFGIIKAFQWERRK